MSIHFSCKNGAIIEVLPGEPRGDVDIMVSGVLVAWFCAETASLKRVLFDKEDPDYRRLRDLGLKLVRSPSSGGENFALQID